MCRINLKRGGGPVSRQHLGTGAAQQRPMVRHRSPMRGIAKLYEAPKRIFGRQPSQRYPHYYAWGAYCHITHATPPYRPSSCSSCHSHQRSAALRPDAYDNFRKHSIFAFHSCVASDTCKSPKQMLTNNLQHSDGDLLHPNVPL